MSDNEPYNPLAKPRLGESVAEALLRAPIRELSDPDDLIGAGVYAIYYQGDFALYRPVSRENKDGQWQQPIYVGKAVPKGGRKGGLGFDAGKGTALKERLRQHAASIEQASNLNLADFHFRALIVDDIWIPLGENVLIDKFRPLWNLVVDGFGNKDPGARRANQHKSSWDVLHPGRAFAAKLADGPLTVDDLTKKVTSFFGGVLSKDEELAPEDEA